VIKTFIISLNSFITAYKSYLTTHTRIAAFYWQYLSHINWNISTISLLAKCNDNHKCEFSMFVEPLREAFESDPTSVLKQNPLMLELNWNRLRHNLHVSVRTNVIMTICKLLGLDHFLPPSCNCKYKVSSDKYRPESSIHTEQLF